MIQAESITIEEFRGIRKLELNLKGENFSVCGPNGTGKSGIVDAIEFALTGNVSRLSGKGTGVVSMKDHGPHVDSRNRPDKAKVRLEVSIPGVKKKAVIERTVKDSAKPTITPADPDVLEVLGYVALHPEFVLSRRELIRYVISAPGDRAKEVQALLRLDKIEDLRASLQKIANACEKQVDPLKREKGRASDQLLKALEITQLTADKILLAVNSRRETLGLTPIETLSATTSFKDGLAAGAVASVGQRITKSEAVSDLRSLRETLGRTTAADIAAATATVVGDLTALSADPIASDVVNRESFLKTAIDLIEGDRCPVCDTPWRAEDLKNVIAEKLKQFDDIAKKKTEIQNKLVPLGELLSDLEDALKRIERQGKLILPATSIKSISDFTLTVASRRKQIEDFLPLDATIKVLDDFDTKPAELDDELAAIEKVIAAIPEPSQQDAARDYLILAQERLEGYQSIGRRAKSAVEQAQLTKKIYDVYVQVSTKVLNDIYKDVEKNFSELYRLANSADEGRFEARLLPSMGKLGFDVGFYGRGFFPPGAYHSEGHQDSMGICLYLALMEHLLEESFSFAVLDDVLMSVDSGHRREMCNLLKRRFPKTQFIVTTHDPIWFRQMKTAGLIGPNASIHFKNWDVNLGPTEWDDRDVWKEIEDYIGKNDVREAASLLRNYLEYSSAEICHRLRAPVEFRADAQYSLGDLLPRGSKRYSELLQKGIKAAHSWDKTEEAENLAVRKKEFDEAVRESKLEEWQINPSIHFNEWANLNKNDFAPVVAAFHKLVDLFFCPKCQALLYVVPEYGNYENLRCICNPGINLKPKKGALA